MSKDGYTLLELLLVLIITSVLITLAIPNYSHHINKVKRQDGKSALLDLAQRLEIYFSENNTYATATIGQQKNTDVLPSSVSPQGFYQLKIAQQTSTSYLLQATPVDGKFRDPVCGVLTINDLGVKGADGSERTKEGECW